MKKTFIYDHPLIDDKLARLRNRTTSVALFRQLVEEVTTLMLYEVAKNLPRTECDVETPLTTTRCRVLAGDPPVLVPILRAGLAMADPLLQLLPHSPVGHVGLVRDHDTLQPVRYLVKLPPMAGRQVWVLDPMLATGGSVSEALGILKEHGAEDISLFAIIAAPEGVARLERDHPDVRLFIAALDERLNEKGYILPGLGDAGDRLYGTE
ncbi:MAG: uracil phosphoribosyltransferase [Bacillota bacterium]|nr:uracil phosphoribosyltransferase [Bacillota bacterium]MDW7684375.1 uracil phosphoribosyltransferase [Bacillota bacterium]